MKIIFHIWKITGTLLGLISGLGFIGAIVGLTLGSLADKLAYSRKIKTTTSALIHCDKQKISTHIKKRDLNNIIHSIAVVSFFSNQTQLKNKDMELIKWELEKDNNISKKDQFVIINLLDSILKDKDKINLCFIGKILKAHSLDIDFSIIFASIFRLCSKKPRYSDWSIFSDTLLPKYCLNEIVMNLNPEEKEKYTILGIGPGTQTDEIKKIYRKLAIQFHPDKLIDLEFRQRAQAKETFLKIKSAYEEIIKERSL